MAYVMGHFADPKDLQELAEIMKRELLAIQQAAGDQDVLNLPVSHRAPDKTFPGQFVYADGSDWNPGSGQGVYVRNVANDAWRFLG